jgi:hypothetical protein
VDLFDVVRSCARRWYIFLPLLAIVTWFSYSAYSSVKPVYYANAVIGISPPSTRIDNVPPGVPLARNGLLDIGGASLIANMTAVGLREPAVVDQVVAAGGEPDYGARMFPVAATMPQLPLVMIEATEAQPEAVTRTLELVITQSEQTLRKLQQQARVPEDQMVAPFVVSPPSAPAAGMPSRTRSTVAIFAAGAGLVVVVTVVADVILTRLRRRIKERSQAKAAAVEPSPDRTPTEVPEPKGVVGVSEGAMDAR